MDIFKNHPQWPDVKKICTVLKDQGFVAWLAGGCVRDGLMGILPNDFDIATDAKPHEVESLFQKTVAVGKSFGVIKVVTDSGEIEVTRFRKDGNYRDGRHPDEVSPGTPLEDAERRDFTINSLFYDIFEDKTYDLVNGKKDISARLIRTVGDPEKRFSEDHLRVMRAVRFVGQLDFDIEEETLKCVYKCAESVKSLSVERVTEELRKIFRSSRVDRAMGLLEDSGILKVIFPELGHAQFETSFFGNIRLWASFEPEFREFLGWMYLLKNMNPKDTRALLARMRLSGYEKTFIEDGLRVSKNLLHFDKLTVSEKKLLAANKSALVSYQLLKLEGIDGETFDKELALKKFLVENKELPDLFLNGKDVLAQGGVSGKEIGAILAEATKAQLEGAFKSREEALKWLKKRS